MNRREFLYYSAALLLGQMAGGPKLAEAAYYEPMIYKRFFQFTEYEERPGTEFLVIHHTGFPNEDKDSTAAAIHKFHQQERKWAGIGYHYLIRKNGMIEQGRRPEAVGAHASHYNKKSVGICLAGNFEIGKPTEAQMDAVYTPVLVKSSSAEDDDGFSMIRDIAGMALPYVNIMLIYFMVLLYSNTVANHVILEKTSKLMDTFLVSVKPRAMVFGKVLAVWVSSLLQLLLWAGGLAGGCALGAKLARSIHPQSTMGILRFFDYLKQVTGFFSPVRILLALLLIAAGFLLYCAMAGVSGSFASKPEELSAAMQINQLILVISFLLVLRVCIGNGSGTPDMIMWYDFVPYTAILVTPARLLMGQIPVWAGLVSVLLTGGLAVLASYFAGKVYSLMSLYKGNALSIKEMFKVILR